MSQDLDMGRLNERFLVLYVREHAPTWVQGLADHKRDFEHILREWHEQIYPDRKEFYAVPDLQLFEPAQKFVGYMANSKAFDGIEDLHGMDLMTKFKPGRGLDYNPDINGLLTELSTPHELPIKNVKNVLRGLSIHQNSNQHHPEWLLTTDKIPGLYLQSCLSLYKEFDQRRQVEAVFAKADERQHNHNTILTSWNLPAWRDNRSETPEPPCSAPSGP